MDNFDQSAAKTSQTPLNQLEEREIVSWRGQDLIIGEKNQTWYVLFFLVVIGLLAFSFLIKSWSFTLLIVASTVAVLVARPSGSRAKTVNYCLTNKGLYINQDFHAYSDYRGFGIVEDGQVFSIVLLPKKRFSPSLTIYFSQQYGEEIVDVFGSRLPMEDIKLDIIDKIVRKINL